jgi:truncated hemoglobin YjbI
MPQDDDLFALLCKHVTTKEISELFTTSDLNEWVHFDYFITQILGAPPFYFASHDTCDEYVRSFMDTLEKDSVLRAVAAASR